MQQLKQLTHDQSGSNIVSIDSFTQLRDEADEIAKFTIDKFRPAPVGITPGSSPTNPKGPGWERPQATQFPTRDRNGDKDDDIELIQTVAGSEQVDENVPFYETTTGLVGSIVGVIAFVGILMVGSAWSYEYRRQKKKMKQQRVVIRSNMDNLQVYGHKPQTPNVSPVKSSRKRYIES
jgi:hypothetical protein